MTGQHSHINGVYALGYGFDAKRSNVAKLLQSAGYLTAIIGKWHLKTQPSGFDYYNVLPGQGVYFNPRFKEIGKEWQDGKEGGEKHEGYVTDITTDLSLNWLKNRNRNKPFFLMYHHKAPHGPWQCDQKHEHLYNDVEMPEPASLWEDKSHRSQGSKNYGTGMYHLATERLLWMYKKSSMPDISNMDENQIKRFGYQSYIKSYMRCVASIDDNVGRMLDYLDAEGLTENTVVIYTSDQGMFLGEHDYYDKRWMFEESLRMPFVIRYPKEIRAGSANDDIILNIDFAPLFLDLAGEKTPSDMQGRSFRENLKASTPPDWRKSMYYRYWMNRGKHNVPAHYGIRTTRYKLVFFYGLRLDNNPAGFGKGESMLPGMELYDLEKDPEELSNVYNDPEYADVVRELKAELLRLKEECKDTDEKYPELMSLREKYW